NSAEQAYSLRNITRLRAAALELLTLQVDGAKEIGSYYLALSLKRIGQIEEAKRLFEITADSAPAPFKSRAVQSLGIISCIRGDLDESIRLQVDALKIASDKTTYDLTTGLMALLDISALNSLLGAHDEALRILETLPLLVRKVSQSNPFYYYVYHNELAVELSAVGRQAEARAILSVALQSPFAPVSQEWHETLVEIDALGTTGSRKTITFTEGTQTGKTLRPAFEADTSQAPSKVSAGDEAQARSSREHIAPESASYVVPDASTAM